MRSLPALPGGWRYQPISELCEKVVVGHVGKSSDSRDPNGIPFLMGKDVSDEGIDLSSYDYVSHKFHEREAFSREMCNWKIHAYLKPS